jgi:hypothetical protein
VAQRRGLGEFGTDPILYQCRVGVPTLKREQHRDWDADTVGGRAAIAVAQGFEQQQDCGRTLASARVTDEDQPPGWETTVELVQYAVCTLAQLARSNSVDTG